MKTTHDSITPMKHHLTLGLCCLLAISSAAVAEKPWWQVFGGIKGGNFAGGFVDDDKKPDAAMRELLAATRFDEWETFEDELVKLSYPKHPLLKLEVNGGEKGVSVEGGVCTTVDNSFQRAYILKAGPFTYGVFLVTVADWLDDGICLCGPMVHHVYRMEDGCLVRFSLLPGGAVKKAQKLGGKLRLMAFEWTHLACQREIYEQLVERMTLKDKHPWDAARFEAEVAKRYGMAGRSGWLHPGTSLAEAIVKLAAATPPEKWWGVVGLIDRLTDDHQVRDPRIVTAILGQGRGNETEVDILKRCAPDELPKWLAAKLTAMRMEKPSQQGPASMFSDPVSDRARDAAALLGELALSDPATAAAAARELFATAEPAWTLAVLQAFDSFDKPPLPPQQLIIEGFARAREAGLTEIATAALELARDAADALTDPAAVEKAILALPKGKTDSEWEKTKAEALKAIKQQATSPEPANPQPPQP